jgi:hypothetical protein
VLIIAICAALAAAGVVMVVRWHGPPPATRPLPRYVATCAAAGLAAGVLAAGAGGRLVMRLLALTSDADGALTEAEATIGEITAGGTAGFIVFSGLPAGLLTGLLYALLVPALPRGRAAGLALGTVVLLIAGWTIEPLRSDNFDFNLVGPDWLSVLSFVALALFQGLVTVAIATRLGGRGAGTAAGSDAGKLALAVFCLLALPGFAIAVSDILAGGAG